MKSQEQTKKDYVFGTPTDKNTFLRHQETFENFELFFNFVVCQKIPCGIREHKDDLILPRK